MSKQETSLASYFDLPNPGLRAYFEHVRAGQPEEYRTPFYKGKTLNSIVQDWLSKLESIEKDWPSLWQWENDLAKKVGPMSIMKPLSERMDDIDHYYQDIQHPGKRISASAIEAVCKEWRNTGHLRVRSQSRTLSRMKKSTNSGNPYFTKRKLVVDKTCPFKLYRTPDGVLQLLASDTDWLTTAVLGWRGQEGGPEPDDVKQRVVWMFPFAVNVAELQVYQPLIEVAQHFNIVPAWISMEAVDAGITRMFDTKSSKDLVICTDFTRFDQHFNKNLQSAALEILDFIFEGDHHFDQWVEDVFWIKYDIPLMYDLGKFRRGMHGMASGSGGTNADETLAHRALQYEAAMRAKSTLNPFSQCLGDDGVLTYPGISVDQVMECYTDHGQDMNQDKQYASTQDCVYLRRWHHVDYRVNDVCAGVYSTCRALGRLAEQERYYDPEQWGAKMVALRSLSILENVKFHPLREEFLDYCIAGDKYRLGIDIPGFLDNIESIAKDAIDLMPDFLGYTKSLQTDRPWKGMKSWWVVQALKDRK